MTFVPVNLTADIFLLLLRSWDYIIFLKTSQAEYLFSVLPHLTPLCFQSLIPRGAACPSLPPRTSTTEVWPQGCISAHSGQFFLAIGYLLNSPSFARRALPSFWGRRLVVMFSVWHQEAQVKPCRAFMHPHWLSENFVLGVKLCVWQPGDLRKMCELKNMCLGLSCAFEGCVLKCHTFLGATI